MSLSRVKTWGNEVLTAGDLNGEFNNILNNPTSLISPATANWDMAGHTLIDAVFKNTPVSFASADTTPSVAGGTVFKTANLVPTTISFFDDGVAGQRIWVVINDANTTVDFTGTNLSGNAGGDWSPSTGDILHAVFISPKWYCTLSTSAVISQNWTPSVGGTATYFTQQGVSFKIGRLVYIHAAISINVLGTGSPTTVNGLPYAGSAGGTSQALSMGESLALASSVVSITPVVAGTSTTVNFYSRLNANVDMSSNAIFGNGAIVRFSGTYLTA